MDELGVLDICFRCSVLIIHIKVAVVVVVMPGNTYLKHLEDMRIAGFSHSQYLLIAVFAYAIFYLGASALQFYVYTREPNKAPETKMALLERGNDALNINPLPDAGNVLSLHGSNWLWAVTAIYIAAFVSGVTVSGISMSTYAIH